MVGGVNGILPYDMCRTGVRNLKRAGVSDTVAMEISGPKTRVMHRFESERRLHNYLARYTRSASKVACPRSGYGIGTGTTGAATVMLFFTPSVTRQVGSSRP